MFALMLILLSSFPLFALDTLWTPVDIPMRDGESLAADFYTLDSTVVKPVILIQTPYNKVSYRYASSLIDTSDTSGLWNLRSYNFVILDWRGFYASTPADSAGYDRGLDGYDAVEWIAARSWCDGNVGTYGGSALGFIQFETAKHHPPHLVCCAPFIKDFKTKYTDYYYGGVFRKRHIEALEGLGFITTDIILAHPTYGFVWEYIENGSDCPESLDVPMLLASGWFDHYPTDCLRAFKDLRERSDPAVRSLHRMVMGPWTHSGVDKLVQGELEFPDAVGVFDGMVKLFFDHFLRGADNGYVATPFLKFFQMGENRWFSTDDWFDLADETDTLYFTSSAGLSSAAPSATFAFDSIIYDPRDPSPSYGSAYFDPFDPSAVAGPVDISDSIESRDDILIYSTNVLTSNLRIDGAVNVELFASSNRLDSDFAARLCDVYPDGRSMILTEGIRRARFRNGFSVEELLTPDSIYIVPVELQEIAHTFLVGHRLRVDITSSDYPRFDINLNNGGEMYVEGDTLIAINRIYHDSTRPSRLILTRSSSVEIAEQNTPVPEGFALLKACPNPFNATTTIAITIGKPSSVKIDVYDLLGRKISTVFDGELPSGTREFRFSPSNAPTGIYLVRGKVDDIALSRTIYYLK